MAKIKCHAVSCSSDIDMDTRKLYIWGGMEHARWLPETVGEAKKRIMHCRNKENKCIVCDAQIHEVIITRTEKTRKQLLG